MLDGPHVFVNHLRWVNPKIQTADFTESGREFSVTYVVMEGLRLTGVLACLPSVWSRTIQIPEYTAIRGGQRLANRAIEANV